MSARTARNLRRVGTAARRTALVIALAVLIIVMAGLIIYYVCCHHRNVRKPEHMMTSVNKSIKKIWKVF